MLPMVSNIKNNTNNQKTNSSERFKLVRYLYMRLINLPFLVACHFQACYLKSIEIISPIISTEKKERKYCKADSPAKGSKRWTTFKVNRKENISD
jgi:hypothetical protein